MSTTSVANLALHEIFLAINFHSSRTTPQAIIKYHKIREYSHSKWPTVSLFLTTFAANLLTAYQVPVLFYKYFANCGFPNIFTDVVSPNN